MMPWKLLSLIVVMTLVLVFVGFNLENSCDISVVFATLPSVPVVITILASFVLGLLAALLLSFFGRGRLKKAAAPHAPQAPAAQAPVSAPQAAAEAGAPGKSRGKGTKRAATGPFKPADGAEPKA